MLLPRDPSADVRNEEGMTMQARTPEDCDRLFGEHVNAGDVEGVVALYEEDGSFVQRDGSVATGRSEIRTAICPAGRGAADSQERRHEGRESGENLAVLYNDWTLAAKGRDGEPIERSGKALEVVRKQPDGTWLFAIDDPYGRG
jgi:uncharacterized protein (TIGR02246 family)